MRLFIVSTSTDLIEEIARLSADPKAGIEVSGHGLPNIGARPDAILLSNTAPQDHCAAVSTTFPGIPVIVVGAEGAPPTPPAGFNGVPCLSMPLTAGDIRTCLQSETTKMPNASGSLRQAGRITLDQTTRSASIDGMSLSLTAKEYDVLAFMADNQGVTLTKEMFLDNLYDAGSEPAMKVIDVFVCKIRRKIKALTGGDPVIHTVWGRGYVLEVPERGSANAVHPPMSNAIGG